MTLRPQILLLPSDTIADIMESSRLTLSTESLFPSFLRYVFKR